MKTYSRTYVILTLLVLLSFGAYAQVPQKMNYQAVVFDNQNSLVKNTGIGLRISIIQGSITGDVIFQETYAPNPVTNSNGVLTVEIGTGSAILGAFELIEWSMGPLFIRSETDISGGTNYSISGVSPILSTPYALYAEKSADSFSGDYNDLSNKPVIDGTETRIQGGNNVGLTGTGSITDPYIINVNTGQGLFTSPVVLLSSQPFTVPQNVSKIKVELWGASGGGGGAGAYSYSYNLLPGGGGGAGGYASQIMDVTAGQQFDVIIGSAGVPGVNATNSGSGLLGDTDGGNGGDSYFAGIKAAGGTGGKRGSYFEYSVYGTPGIDNIGTITANAFSGGSNLLEVFYGIARSYLAERRFTSTPGKGGVLEGSIEPTQGEGGAAIITFLE